MPGGGVSGTCRVYIAEEEGINRNVIDDLVWPTLVAVGRCM